MKKRILAGILSAVIAAGTLPAISVSAKIDLKNLPTPIAQKDIEDFQKSKPKLKYDGGYYLTWSEVDGALYYEVYRRSANGSGSFTKAGETLYCNFSDFNEGQYRVRAVTFTYDDKKKYSDYSNTATVVYDYDDYYEAPSGAPVEGDDEAADYEEADEYEPAEEVSAGAPPIGAEEYLPEADYEEEDYDYDFPNTEEYKHSEESGYKNPAITPLSTFSADVDTASYANIRRLINDGDKVPADAVRIEEMLNYFDYSYPKPAKTTFNINTELTDCPWNSSSQLLKVGIQGKDLVETPASNLVFLIDTSGSMNWSKEEKIDLVIKSIKTLSKTMTSKDRISIVTYSGEERIILAGARGSQVNTVSKITSLLEADGSTNGESGINAAYTLAEKYFI
ncbi:MAG: von Willebrand factor type A domain-containing protein, partial [Oscillospiraceae bacterium]|nr:von Willebrand factor type A domain-containing protein [Oscillospiraceae bacterium]